MKKGNISNIKNRNKYGITAGIIGLISNLLLGILKLIIGVISNSVSVVVDSINNITDSFSSILIIIGFSLVNKRPTKHHPYGYARYEYICGLFISIFILSTGVLFFKESLIKIFSKETINITYITFIVLILGIIIKYIQMKLYMYYSKKIDSDTLKTSSLDSKNDIISSFGIFLSMIIMKIFNINLDGYIGIIVSIIMIYNSIKMIREVIDPIIGLMPNSKYVEEIKNRLLEYQYVIGIHDLVIHNYGVNNNFITVHVEVDSKLDLIKAHDIIDNIERDFKNNSINLTIHIDPVTVFNKKNDLLKMKVIKALKKYDNTLEIHDFRIVEGISHTNIIFECVIPYDKYYNKKDIIKYLKNNINDNTLYYYDIELERPLS